MIALFENLWSGNITPCDTCGRRDPEVAELAELLERNKTSLDKVLNDKQKEMLDNYIANYKEYSYLITVHAFRSGFSLACKLLTEALSPDL